jgi:hypothetical protein
MLIGLGLELFCILPTVVRTSNVGFAFELTNRFRIALSFHSTLLSSQIICMIGWKKSNKQPAPLKPQDAQVSLMDLGKGYSSFITKPKDAAPLSGDGDDSAPGSASDK